MKNKTLSKREIFKIVILCCALIMIIFRVFVEYAAKKKGYIFCMIICIEL